MEICKEENYKEHLMKIRWEVKIGGRCVRVLTVVSAFDARQDEKQQAIWLEINAIETGLDNELIIRRPRDDYQIKYEVLTVHLVLYGNGSRIHLRDKVAKLVASNLPVEVYKFNNSLLSSFTTTTTKMEEKGEAEVEEERRGRLSSSSRTLSHGEFHQGEFSESLGTTPEMEAQT
uniref:Uncharacterized protein n=1 Tax=Vespula pensylvanica TaxID=30213 RepID=A0A834NK69_VESPE|nr:hypothetical protein H0235_013026 [Vespula pensylvanica]